MFYHKLDLQKVLDGGPWTFEQNVLLYDKLKENVDPHMMSLIMTHVWIQVYAIPMGMMSEKLLQSIGNFIREFVKSDPTNLTGNWIVRTN